VTRDNEIDCNAYASSNTDALAIRCAFDFINRIVLLWFLLCWVGFLLPSYPLQNIAIARMVAISIGLARDLVTR
jgi:hypothetical protein